MLTVAPGPIHHIQLATGVPAPPKGEEYPAPTEAVLALAADAVLAKTVSHGKRTAIPCYYAIMLSFDRTPPGPVYSRPPFPPLGQPSIILICGWAQIRGCMRCADVLLKY